MVGRIIVLIAAMLLLALPLLAPNNFIIHAFSVALIYAILAASWDLLFGFAGIISFGHAGFFGLGAYAAALVTYYAGLSPWWGLPIGGIAGALLGAVIGIPTLRLRGVYQALSALAFAESLRVIASNWHSVTRGTLGFNQHSTFFRLSGESHADYYLLLFMTIAIVGSIWWIATRTSLGLTFRAVKGDDIRAAALGIDVVRQRIVVFMLGGLFAGLAGALYAHFVGLVSPTEFAAPLTILVVAMATIGGIGTIVGPAIAAICLYMLTELMHLHLGGAIYSQIGVGILLIFFVLYLPDGIAGWLRRRLGSSRAREQAK